MEATEVIRKIKKNYPIETNNGGGNVMLSKINKNNSSNNRF